jgi:hypothetical protein
MLYVLLGLGALVLAEGAGLWLLWRKLEAGRDDAAVARVAALGAADAMKTAFDDLVAARSALAKQNDLENHNDAQTVQAAPGLDDALTRIGGLR